MVQVEVNEFILFSKERLLELAKEYFVSRKGWSIVPTTEAEKVFDEDTVKNVDLILRDGNNIIFVLVPRIVKGEISKSAILAYLAKASKYASLADKVYLLLPKGIYSPRYIDGRLLKECGVGVLIYSHGKIEEAFPSFSSKKVQTISEIRELKTKIKELEDKLMVLIDEVSLIKSHLDKLDTIVQEIENKVSKVSAGSSAAFSGELERILSRLKVLEKEIKYIKGRTALSTVRESEVSLSKSVSRESDEELPDYLVDNPWLNVLSKRGR